MNRPGVPAADPALLDAHQRLVGALRQYLEVAEPLAYQTQGDPQQDHWPASLQTC